MNEIELSSRYYLCTPKPQLAYAVGERDLAHLEDEIQRIPPETNWYERLATISWGVVPTAGFNLLSLRSLTDVPAWLWIINWVVLLVFFILGVLFYSIEKKRQTTVRSSVGSVLKCLAKIKETLRIPAVQPDEPVLQILSATYGVGDKWLDVASVLRGRVEAGRISIQAGNHLAGDPALNQAKSLIVKYSIAGETRSKTVAEGEQLELP